MSENDVGERRASEGPRQGTGGGRGGSGGAASGRCAVDGVSGSARRRWRQSDGGAPPPPPPLGAATHRWDDTLRLVARERQRIPAPLGVLVLLRHDAELLVLVRGEEAHVEQEHRFRGHFEVEEGEAEPRRDDAGGGNRKDERHLERGDAHRDPELHTAAVRGEETEQELGVLQRNRDVGEDVDGEVVVGAAVKLGDERE